MLSKMFNRIVAVLTLKRNRSFFILKINFFEFFSKFLHKVFLKLYPVTGIKNGQKRLSDFEGKFILCLKWSKWGKC